MAVQIDVHLGRHDVMSGHFNVISGHVTSRERFSVAQQPRGSAPERGCVHQGMFQPNRGGTMQLVHLYLNFPGNTAEALRFYETVFGTKVAMVQTFEEASFMANVPESAKKKIVHAQLPITETVHMMASDAIEGFGPPLKVGTNFSISIVAKDKAEADRAFKALSSEGGKVTMPIANAPWGPYFGMCTDRYDVQWMVSLPNPV
jgi:PhnB protein